MEKIKNQLLVDIEEGDLTFDPTYKFDIKTTNYDTSKKNRVPSWCDRILWKRNINIQQLKYNSANYLNSDHRPIYGIFKVKYEKTYDDFICRTDGNIGGRMKSNRELEKVKTQFSNIYFNLLTLIYRHKSKSNRERIR